MFKNYIKIAWRSLLKHPRTTAINVFGLTIGMAAAVLITLWVQNELSYDNYHKDADRIYRIKAIVDVSKTEAWKWENTQYVLGDFAKKNIPEIERLTRAQVSPQTVLKYNNEATTEQGAAYVDNEWFNFFHYDFKQGSAHAFLSDPFGMIMTESTAKRYFGNSDAIGKVVRIDTISYQVRAIIKDNPANSSFQFTTIMSIASQMSNKHYKDENAKWGNYMFHTFVKLKPAANAAQLAVKLDTLLKRNQPKTNASYKVLTLKSMHLDNDLQSFTFDHGNIKSVEIFAILALLIVITASINYVNLTTARASIRAKEVSVRKIVGAGRWQLFNQFMAESFVVSALSLLFALIIVELAIPGFNNLTGKHFTQPLAQSATWLILGGTLIASFVLNGIYPAILLSSFKPMGVFRGTSLLSFKDASMRKVLVTLQFSISVVLITGTIVIYRQLNYMQKVNIGYNKEHVFTFTFQYWRIPGFNFKQAGTLLKTIRQQLDRETAFASVAQANQSIVDFDNTSAGSFDWHGRPKDFDPAVAPFNGDINLQQLIQFKMKEGHWFTPTDKHNVILNETAVQQFNMQKPLLGQVFYHRGDTGVVIGVVKDFYFRSLHQKIGPLIIENSDDQLQTFYIKTKANYDAEAIAAAQKIYHQYLPEQPFNYSFLDEKYDQLYSKEQKASSLITVFAGIAILISALGLLGLATFAAEQRIKEIGIRKVLGASIQHIVTLLSTDFVKIVIIASLIAFPVAWWAMNKWLQDFAYKIDLSWWIFALAGSSALIVALATVSVEAIKAAVANPVKSLRSE